MQVPIFGPASRSCMCDDRPMTLLNRQAVVSLYPVVSSPMQHSGCRMHLPSRRTHAPAGLVCMLDRECERDDRAWYRRSWSFRPDQVPAAVGPARNRSRRVERKTNLRGESKTLLSQGKQNPHPQIRFPKVRKSPSQYIITNCSVPCPCRSSSLASPASSTPESTGAKLKLSITLRSLKKGQPNPSFPQTRPRWRDRDPGLPLAPKLRTPKGILRGKVDASFVEGRARPKKGGDPARQPCFPESNYPRQAVSPSPRDTPSTLSRSVPPAAAGCRSLWGGSTYICHVCFNR